MNVVARECKGIPVRSLNVVLSSVIDTLMGETIFIADKVKSGPVGSAARGSMMYCGFRFTKKLFEVMVLRGYMNKIKRFTCDDRVEV